MKYAAGIVLLALCLLSHGSMRAQSDTTTPPAILKRALSFAGTWESKVSMTMDGKFSQFKYTVRSRVIADGHGVYMEEDATIPGMGRLLGGDLVGFDPYESKLHWYSVDNQGTTHDHKCELVTPEHLQLVHESQRDGKPFKEVVDFEWTGPKSLNFKMDATLDGKPFQSVTGVFKKKGK